VREALTHELNVRRGAALERLFGARGGLLEHARQANDALCAGTGLLLPAVERYTGVVWEHLEPATLDAEQRGCLLVPSAPYGLSRGVDPVADFRLSMSVSLGELGVLSKFWRPAVTDRLRALGRDRLVVDLLPAEHAAAVDFDLLGRDVDVMRVRFLTSEGSKAAGHGAKAVKGILARHLLERGTQRLGAFTWEGWRSARVAGDLEVYAPPSTPPKARR
jgi:cytoplasmic iron level regulating protein YaaA (DUF328/UPF0246 family)